MSADWTRRMLRACASRGLVAGFLLGSTPAATAEYKLDYVGSWNMPAGNGSDCWGWTAPDGAEYAIMGFRDGIAFVQAAPAVQLIQIKPGPMGSNGYIWRDIKTYQHYAYTVSEATGTYSGVSVYDLSFLPDSVRYVGSFSTNGGSGYTSHNINIDEARGYAYVEGDGTQKVRVLDLSDPENPTFVNYFGTSFGQIHDMVARNDTVWVAEGSAGTWSIWDLTNKQAPQMLARVGIPSAGYVHNIWPSPDGQYCVTTEETFGKTIKVWDISDYGNIRMISQYLAPNGMCHNAHWFGDFHVNSHYESGIQLMDASNPYNPVELDRVDIWPANDGRSYNGTWGAFPYTQNGYVYASNTDGKLWIFEITAACPLADVPSTDFAPVDGSSGINQPYTLAWEDVLDADSYNIQVDDDPSFGSPAVDANQAGSELEISGLELETTYYWRVQSVNGCGASDWSEVMAFTTGCIIAVTGDVDVSGTVTATDIIELVNYVFKSGTPPLPVAEAGDVNCSGDVTAEDIIYLVNFTFKAGPAPCDACGIL